MAKRIVHPLVRFEESEMKRLEWCMKFAEKIGIKDTDLILDIGSGKGLLVSCISNLALKRT